MAGSTPFESPGALKRYTEYEYLLLGDLRDLLEEPVDRQNRRWLLAVVDALLQTLPAEFELREEGGYLSEVLDEYPNWYSQVEHLRAEQTDLCERLRDLRGRLAAHSELDSVRNMLRIELRDWMKRLIAHNRHESRLLHTAINPEVGTGD